jgi:hypothetical protein
MKTRLYLFILSLLPVSFQNAFPQAEGYPEPPGIKSYKGVAGKVTKYNNFNYLEIRDEAGQNNRQAMGRYWEISYNYDSVFRQKKKFRDFVVNEINQSKGSIFFEDTLQVHFVIPSDGGNIWGRMVLTNDKSYRMRLIREEPFVNKIQFDTKPVAVFDQYVDSVPLPPRINYMPKSVITRVQHSKYDHQEFTWNDKDTLFRQKVMGPFWELKIDVRNSQNQVDKHVSTVEILESYYRACVKANGKVKKSRPRELVFTLPMNKAMLWVRVTVSLDGVYFVRVVMQDDKDKTEPEKMVSVPSNPQDSVKIKTGL